MDVMEEHGTTPMVERFVNGITFTIKAGNVGMWYMKNVENATHNM